MRRMQRMGRPGAGVTALVMGVAVMVSTLAVADEELTWADPARVAAVMAGEISEADLAWWGFDATDATRFLRAAFDSPATKLTIPVMTTPWVTLPLEIRRDNLELEFAQGAVVEAKQGAFKGRNEVMLRIWNRRNIKLRGYGATLRMHKRDYWQPPYKRSEWRHLLDIRGSNDILIEGLTLAESGGDGIYISGTEEQMWSQNITIRNVVSTGNNRQGMSVISVENLLVERSLFNNTIGMAPMAGIDLEPNNERQRIANVVIQDSIFLNNSQLGMHIWLGHLRKSSKPVSVVFARNYIRGGEIGIHVATVRDDGPSGLIRIHDNVVEGTQHAGILMRQFSARSGMKVEFARNRLINTTRRGPYSEEEIEFYLTYSKLESPGLWWRPKVPSAPIVLTAQNSVSSRQGGVTFDNDLIIDDRDEPMVIIGGPWGAHQELFASVKEGDAKPQFEYWHKVDGVVRVINPHGARIDGTACGDDFGLQLNRSNKSD